MAFYAYCLLRLSSDEPWPVLKGIQDLPVFPFRCDKYTMLLSRLGRDFSFTPRSIVEHGQVISRVFETHTVLPMRFATFFGSQKQITNMIRENQKDLLEAFCRLRGKSEMRLKLVSQTMSLEPASPKKPPQKIMRLAEPRPNGANGQEGVLDSKNRELVDEMAARFLKTFRPLEQQICGRMMQSRELLVDCAHLIESQKVEAYLKLHTSLSGQLKDWEVRISGPWPPYHFLPATVRMPAASTLPFGRRVSVGSR